MTVETLLKRLTTTGLLATVVGYGVFSSSATPNLQGAATGDKVVYHNGSYLAKLNDYCREQFTQGSYHVVSYKYCLSGAKTSFEFARNTFLDSSGKPDDEKVLQTCEGLYHKNVARGLVKSVSFGSSANEHHENLDVCEFTMTAPECGDRKVIVRPTSKINNKKYFNSSKYLEICESASIAASKGTLTNVYLGRSRKLNGKKKDIAIGIRLDERANEAGVMNKELPKNWHEIVDRKTGKIYYLNTKTNEKTRTRPEKVTLAVQETNA